MLILWFLGYTVQKTIIFNVYGIKRQWKWEYFHEITLLNSSSNLKIKYFCGIRLPYLFLQLNLFCVLDPLIQLPILHAH